MITLKRDFYCGTPVKLSSVICPGVLEIGRYDEFVARNIDSFLLEANFFCAAQENVKVYSQGVEF